jgi:hypothetical protein
MPTPEPEEQGLERRGHATTVDSIGRSVSLLTRVSPGQHTVEPGQACSQKVKGFESPWVH